MKRRCILCFNIFFAIFAIIYILSKPDLGGKRSLLKESGFDMNEFSCVSIPYYIYKPIPFSLVDIDSGTRYKFKLSKNEFSKFKDKYYDILNWEGKQHGEGLPGESEYLYKIEYVWSYYKFSRNRTIVIFYVPLLQEMKFVIFDY